LEAFAVEMVDQPYFGSSIPIVHSVKRTPDKASVASPKVPRPRRSHAPPIRLQLRDRNRYSAPNQSTLCVSRFEQVLPSFRGTKLGGIAVLANQQLGSTVDILLRSHLTVVPCIVTSQGSCRPHQTVIRRFTPAAHPPQSSTQSPVNHIQLLGH
jgi:hypothetical protein